MRIIVQKRKRMKKFVLTVLCGILAMSGPKQAEAEYVLDDLLGNFEVGASMSVGVYDKYMWRGFKLDKDKVIQPAVSFSAGIFEGGYWASYDTQNEDALASDEQDGWVGISIDLGFIDEALDIISVSLGNTWYDFPESDAYSEELYLTVAADTFLSPYFSWFHDYGDEAQGGADGNYFMFGIGHSVTLLEDYGITLDLGYELGLNNEAFIAGDGGYNLITAGFTIPLTENATLAPMVGYSAPFGDLEDAGDGDQDDEFYGGFSFEISS